MGATPIDTVRVGTEDSFASRTKSQGILREPRTDSASARLTYGGLRFIRQCQEASNKQSVCTLSPEEDTSKGTPKSVAILAPSRRRDTTVRFPLPDLRCMYYSRRRMFGLRLCARDGQASKHDSASGGRDCSFGDRTQPCQGAEPGRRRRCLRRGGKVGCRTRNSHR